MGRKGKEKVPEVEIPIEKVRKTRSSTTREAGQSSNPQSQQGQQRSRGRGRTLKPHEENIYNINFRSDEQRARYDILFERPMVPTRFLDMELMEKLGFAEDIRLLCSKIGGSIILNGPFNTYRKYVLEFLSSLRVHAMHQNVEATSVKIKFRINGIGQSFDGEEFNEIYGFRNGERVIKNNQLERFWKRLTGMQTYAPSSAKCSLITNPVIRCFQKALANSILARGDSQNVCRRQELYILWAALRSEDPIDLGYHMLKQFNDVSNKTEGPICVGGMITPILNLLGVDLSREEPVEGPMLLDLHVFTQSRLLMQHGRDIFLQTPRIKLPNRAMTTIQNNANWQLGACDVVEVEDEEDVEDQNDDDDASDDDDDGEGANIQSIRDDVQRISTRQDAQDAMLKQMADQMQHLYRHFFPPPPPPPTA